MTSENFTQLYKEIEDKIWRIHLSLNHDHAGPYEDGQRKVIVEIAEILDKYTKIC